MDQKVAVSSNKEELYQAVEDLCLHKSGPVVYENLSAVCKSIIEVRINVLSGQTSLDHASYLQAVEKVWSHHCDMMLTIRNIFLYLDRSYAMLHQNQFTSNNVLILTICEMGNYYFKQHLAQRKDIEDRIILALLAAVRVDRESNNPRFSFREAQAQHSGSSVSSSVSALSAASSIVDYGIMRACCRMLQSLGLYETKFEPCLVHESTSFFTMESQELLTIESQGEVENSEGESDTAPGVISATSGGGVMSAAAAQYYLYHVDFRMAQVSTMVNRYLLFECSRHSLINVIERTLLAPVHTTLLIESGFSALLTAHAVQDISKLYSLLSRLSAGTVAAPSTIIQALCNQWGSYIKRVGEQILCSDMGGNTTAGASSAATKDTISEIIALQERLAEVLRVCFHQQDIFRVAFKNSFEYVLNSSAIPSPAGKPAVSCSSKVSELLAKYFDKRLRSGGHGTTAAASVSQDGGVSMGLGLDLDMQLEQSLEKCLVLFFYVNSKDIFEAFYRKYLSRRLLLGKSASEELERSIVSKLKAECGSNYTSKLEGMFTDMELSKDIMVQYALHTGSNTGASTVSGAARVAGTKIDAHFQVLTTGFWPTPAVHFTQDPSTLPALFPTEIRQVQEHFSEFYHKKYQGRRLSWSYSLDRCLVTARFPKGKKEVEVSFHQALVLCCFNTEQLQARSALTYAEIKQAVPLADSELQRTIISLCNGPIGTRVLTKHPKGRDLNVDTDVIKFNADFVSKLYHIKINAIQVCAHACTVFDNILVLFDFVRSPVSHVFVLLTNCLFDHDDACNCTSSGRRWRRRRR